MIEIPRQRDAIQSALLATGRAYGRAVADAIEERLRPTELQRVNESVSVLNLSRNPEHEREVLEAFSGGGTVEHVCTTNSKHLRGERIADVWYSEIFGAQFWEDVAVHSEPGIVLSDGSLSDIHQVQMLKILFPAMASGGSMILQQPSGDSENAIVTFVRGLAAAQMRRDKQAYEAYDATGYLLRNIDMISFASQCVILKKRKTTQQRLEAVPFSTLALDHRTLDSPVGYARITPKISGPDRVKRRNKHIVDTMADVLAPPAEIGRLRNAVITGGGIIHTHDGYIIEESFINNRHASRRGPFFRIGSSSHYVSERSLDPAITVTGQSALMKQTWDANYGHWLVDTLPRMDYYASELDLQHTSVIVNGSLKPALQEMQASSLQLFGVGQDNLVKVDWQPTMVEDLVYVTPSSIPPLIKSPRSIRILEQLSGRVATETMKRFAGIDRIYLTRNAYPRRRLLNENAILPIIQASGYRIVEPESLSFEEQVALFSQATHVVGNMGAAFSNLAFSPSGVRVLMLATEHMMHDYFYDLVCHKGGEYRSLQGIAEGAVSGIGADFTVDEESFSRIFSDFDAR